MKALFPCEEVVRKYLPAMRVSIAKKLRKKGFTQQAIASELGLTQAAVSKYLSNDYGKPVRDTEKHHIVDKATTEIADKIASGAWRERQVTNAICSTCIQFNAEIGDCNLVVNSMTKN